MNKSFKKNNTSVIGVMGADHGVGTTHLAFMIGNYLKNILGETVAFANIQGDSLIKAENFGFGPQKQYFSIHGIDLYHSIDINTFFRDVYGGYNYIVFDISPGSKRVNSEFVRCDKRIVVGSLSEWKFDNFCACVKEWREVNQIKFCSLSYNVKNSIQMYNKFGIRIINIPFNENPFFIKPQNAEWLKKMSQ